MSKPAPRSFGQEVGDVVAKLGAAACEHQVISADIVFADSFRGLHVRGIPSQAVQLAPRSVGWPADEVAALNAARIAGKSDDAIRRLVLKLEAARKSAARAA